MRRKVMNRKYLLRMPCLPALLAAMAFGAAGRANAQMPVPVFGQHWALCQEDLFGGVNSPEPEYGAAVSSMAMVLRYYGLATDQGELDTWFTRSGLQPGDPGLWDAAAGRVSGLTVDRWDWQDAPADLNVINSALDAGYPVIAECRLPYNDSEGQKHYVVLTGRSGSTYFVNDPWYGEANTFDQRYHDPARYIYGVRIFRGTPAALGGASPHGFARGGAAWWCDWEAHWNGWDLAFVPNTALAAPWQWYDVVTGANRSDRPSVGAIAVFQNAANGGVGGASGHVAYVIAVNGDQFRVRQSGWPNPWPSEAEFEFASGDTVRVVDGKPADPPTRLRGFLTQSSQPANWQPLTAPPPAGARCQRRVLIISSNPRDLIAVKTTAAALPEMPSLALDIQTRLPDSLDGYAAVWFADTTSVESGTGAALASYVQNGGGLVACGSVAAALAKGTLDAGGQWMGIRNSYDGFNWESAPSQGVVFPSPFLGVDLGSADGWMPLDQGRLLTVDMEYASGHQEINGEYSYDAICYTAHIGKGRYFFLSSSDNLGVQPVLAKALCAGLRWVMAN